MPQMSPLNWLFLMMMFIFILMISVTFNYYNYMYLNKSIFNKSLNKKLNYWKW